jgi:hypothetical protein
MRKRLLPVLGLCLLLLIGFATGVMWWMNAQTTQETNAPLHAHQCGGHGSSASASPAAGNTASTAARDSAPEHSSATTDGGTGTEGAPQQSPEPESTTPEPEPEEPPEEPPAGRFQFSCTISGRVMDQSGRGIAEAEVIAILLVHCVTKSGEAKRLGPTRHSKTWITDENGRYAATIRLGSNWDVETVDATMSAELAGLAPIAVVRVERIKPHERRTGADITMVPGGSIAGFVRDETGNPLEDVVIFAVLRDSDTSGAGRAGRIIGEQYTVRTDSDGHYQIAAVKEGVWHISALSAKHGIMKTSPIVTVVAGREAKADDLVLGTSVVVKMRLVDPDGNTIKADKSKMLYAEARLTVNDNVLRTQLAIDDAGTATVHKVPLETTSITIVLGEHLEKELGKRLYSDPVAVALLPGTENDIGEVRVKSSTRD